MKEEFYELMHEVDEAHDLQWNTFIILELHMWWLKVYFKP